MIQELLLQSGKRVLLGNGAVVRGALESGVQFVSTYPGTPASEIGDAFYQLQAPSSKLQVPSSKLQAPSSKFQANYYFEYSVNEKVALEAGIGASYSGLKTLVAMKNFGLNVCQDALLPLAYTGTVGPMVLVVADDPGCHSSGQSEQNSRAIAHLAYLPVLEPADPQEARNFVKLGFVLSEKFKLPVILRLTTRVAHQSAVVDLGKLPPSKPVRGRFVKNKKQFVTMPPRVLEMKNELLEKIEKIRAWSEKTNINFLVNGNLRVLSSKLQAPSHKLGIITAGVSYLYILEALKEMNLNLPVLKLGLFYPLAEQKIKDFLKNKKKVLIVEELEPWLENEVVRLAKEANPKLKISGKDLLPITGELKPEMVTAAVAKFANRHYKLQTINYKLNLSTRFPQPCLGCPYWFSFGAIKKAFASKEIIWGGDIGCYMLANSPILDLQDYLSCMGSSLGIGHGIKKASRQKAILFIGDSTFFHAGIPGLINIVFNQSDPLIIIMDNQTTAMTGQQPNPGQRIKIEEIVKACGIKHLKVIDPIKQKEFLRAVKEFLNKKEAAVIISRRPCIRL